MIDLPSLGLILGGTVLATMLQSGWRASGICLVEVCTLLARPFNQARTKADLARQIADLQRDGLIRAHPRRIADEEFSQLTRAMLAARSLEPLLVGHETQRQRRKARAELAVAVCRQAAELAPVLGLAGTLLALGRIGSPEALGGAIAAAIGMAVSTTLYGVLLANLWFMPLAGLIERRAKREDQAREEVFGWLQSHARNTAPRAPVPATPTAPVAKRAAA